MRFKILIGVALGLHVDEKYTFSDARTKRKPVQYVRAIIHHTTSATILDVPNQLFVVYKSLANKLCVFILPPVESTKASKFILHLEKKLECWADLFSCPSLQYISQFSPRRPILSFVSSIYYGRLPWQVEKYLRYRVPQPLIALLGRLIPQKTQYLQYLQVQAYNTPTQFTHR